MAFSQLFMLRHICDCAVADTCFRLGVLRSSGCLQKTIGVKYFSLFEKYGFGNGLFQSLLVSNCTRRRFVSFSKCKYQANAMSANGTNEPKANGRYNGRINGVEGKTPFLIGVAGGTASGKSTVCKRIMEKLGQVDVENAQRQVVSISQDSFYRELTPSERSKAEKGLFNFDHPDAFNEDLIFQTMKDILAGKKCEIPVYDYRTNSRCEGQFSTIYPADVVLFEGILVFYFPEIRDLFHMKLFVDTDSDTRLARRVPRDINERGRDLEQVLNQYMNYVKPAFEEFCLPTKKFADVIIPRGADNTVAIDLIVQHIREFLANRKQDQMRGEALDQAQARAPPSPATSPVHGVRRPNTPDVFYKRPH